MKVLILTPCVLPVPAVKGGAVLDLVETLVKENEVFQNAEFTVVSSYDREAVEASKKYEHTKFIFLKRNVFANFADKIIDGALKQIKKRYRPHLYFWKLYVLKEHQRIMLNDDFDAIVFENSGFLLNSIKNQNVMNKYKDKFYYHIHNDIPKNIFVEGFRKCKILSISKYLQKNAELICGKISDDNFLILHNGFDCIKYMQELTENEKSRLRTKLGIAQNKKIIMFAGRIDPAKGIDKLVDAVQMLDRKDIVLLVIGAYNFASGQTSPFEEKMKRKFEELGEKVVFTGYIKHDDIWQYYKLSDVAALPSMWEEPAGLTIMEAMAAGLPVISTVSGGIPEFLTEEYGVLLHRDDKIVSNLRKTIIAVIDNLDYWKEKRNESSLYIQSIADNSTYYKTFIQYMGKGEM